MTKIEEVDEENKPHEVVVRELISSSSLHFIDKKSEKLIFDAAGHVVAVNLGLTKREKEEEALASQERRRMVKVERKRMLVKMSAIPEQEIDSEIDGLSSLSSIDEEHGLRNYNPQKAIDKMQEEQGQHLWEVHRAICLLPVTQQH